MTYIRILNNPIKVGFQTSFELDGFRTQIDPFFIYSYEITYLESEELIPLEETQYIRQ